MSKIKELTNLFIPDIIGLKNGLFHFLLYRGMDDQIVKNQYVSKKRLSDIKSPGVESLSI